LRRPGDASLQRIDLVLSGINLGLNLGNSCCTPAHLPQQNRPACSASAIAFSTAMSDKQEPDFAALEPYVRKCDLLLEEKSNVSR